MLDKTGYPSTEANYTVVHGFTTREELAEARGLTLVELMALESIEEDLRNGVIRPFNEVTGYGSFPTVLNMRVWHCGSVACIGGHVEARCGYHNGEFAGKTERYGGLHELCYPPESIMRNLLPKKAARAIRKFIETGWPCY